MGFLGARLLAVPLALVWVISGLGPADAAPSAAAAAPCVSLTGTQPVSPSSPGVCADVGGVATLSACNAWLVGHTIDENPSLVANDMLIEHWDGTSWTLSTAPSIAAGGRGMLFAVTANGARNAFAVGGTFNVTGGGTETQTPVLLRWDGSTWAQVNTPSLGDASAILESVSASSQDVWMTGDFNTDTTPTEALALHCC